MNRWRCGQQSGRRRRLLCNGADTGCVSRIDYITGRESGPTSLDTGCELRTLTGHTDHVTAVAVTPDGKRAVSASRGWTIKVWDLATEEAFATFTCDTQALCCGFSEALKLIVGGAGHHLHILRLEEARPKPDVFSN